MNRAVERVAARRVAVVADRVAAQVAVVAPGARVERSGDDVVVTGRGLSAEPLLRWPAGLIR